jgi:microcystin-dependent protein
MSNIVSQFVDQVDDTKINITANGLNKPLSDAINDGDIGAGASFKLEIVGHSFSLLEPVYHDGTDWVIAQASQANTLPLYVVTKIDGNVVTFTKFGKVEITGHGLLVGEYYFASQAVAGAITSAEPTSGYSCPVLYVEDANNVHILVHRPSLIGTGPGDDSEVGSVVAFATDIDPAGFILCDGSAVSRIEYAELFAVIGTRHGSGDGSTTFNLPDMRGKFIRGWDNGAGNDPNSGSRTAPVTGAATADNVGSTQGDATAVNSLSMSTDGGHNHESFSSSAGKRLALYSSSRATANPNTLASNVVTGTSGSPGVAALTTSNGSHSHPLSGDPETRPLNVYMAYYIRYSPKPLLKEGLNLVKFQTKTLGSILQASTTDIADLRFQNLTIGKVYKIHLTGRFGTQNNTGATLSAVHDGSTIIRLDDHARNVTSPLAYRVLSDSFTFTATATSVIFSCTASGNARIMSGSTRAQIFEYQGNHEEVSEF